MKITYARSFEQSILPVKQETESQESLIEKIREKLKKGVCLFAYEKGDGSIRYATGTLAQELLPLRPEDKLKIAVEVIREDIESLSPEEGRPFGDFIGEFTERFHKRQPEKRPYAKSDSMLNYYDLEAKAWRACFLNKIYCLINV